MQQYTIAGKYSDALVTGNIDEATTSQVIRMINSPAINGPVAIMPDGHAGKGSVVGFTMEFKDKVCPNTVGVDIGCGVSAYLSDGLGGLTPKQIYDSIRRNVPTGFHVRKKAAYTFADLDIKTCEQRHQYCLTLKVDPIGYEELAMKIGMKMGRMLDSIGTLGGGELVATG